MPKGCLPTVTVAITVAVVVSTTETVPEPWFVT